MSEHITFREETRKAAIWSGWITFGLDFFFVCLFIFGFYSVYSH